MLILKVDGNTIDIKYNYRLYKNIVGDDPKEQDEKFDTFISGLVYDDVDQILKFGVAASQNKLTSENVADQLDEQGAFDDVHKTTTEILKGLCNSGFLASKARSWMKYVKGMIKGMSKVYTELSKEDLSKLTKKEQENRQEQLNQTQIQLETGKQQLEVVEKRLIFPKNQNSASTD